MSSDQRPQPGIVETATAIGNRVYAQVYEGIGSRVGPLAAGRAAGAVEMATKSAVGLSDLAQDLAGLVLHTATQIGRSLVEAASELESVIARHPVPGPVGGAPAGGGPVQGPVAGPVDGPVEGPVEGPGEGPGGDAPSPALVLPDASPGRPSAATFVVRNASLDTVDALRPRCAGLFGPADVRIAGHHVKFSPLTVDVAPGGTASVTCTVAVPAEAKRAHYVGLIEAAGINRVQLLVSLDVI